MTGSRSENSSRKPVRSVSIRVVDSVNRGVFVVIHSSVVNRTRFKGILDANVHVGDFQVQTRITRQNPLAPYEMAVILVQTGTQTEWNLPSDIALEIPTGVIGSPTYRVARLWHETATYQEQSKTYAEVQDRMEKSLIRYQRWYQEWRENQNG